MEAYSERQIKKAWNNHTPREENKGIYNTFNPELKMIAESKGKDGILWTIKCFLKDLKESENRWKTERNSKDYYSAIRLRKRLINLNKCFLYL